jgi:hypothetical protein
VNELLSMLVPLETLSGWPRVTNPTPLQVLVLLVGFPLLVFIIVVAISKIATSIHAGRGDDIHANDPLWVGDHESAELEAAGANPGPDTGEQTPAGDAAEVLAGEGEVEGDDTGEHVGGAGARW